VKPATIIAAAYATACAAFLAAIRYEDRQRKVASVPTDEDYAAFVEWCKGWGGKP
jgi:hypothetical protein